MNPLYFWLGADADREFCRMAGEALGLPRNEFLEDDPSDSFWRAPLPGPAIYASWVEGSEAGRHS